MNVILPYRHFARFARTLPGQHAPDCELRWQGIRCVGGTGRSRPGALLNNKRSSSHEINCGSSRNKLRLFLGRRPDRPVSFRPSIRSTCARWRLQASQREDQRSRLLDHRSPAYRAANSIAGVLGSGPLPDARGGGGGESAGRNRGRIAGKDLASDHYGRRAATAWWTTRRRNWSPADSRGG